MCTPVSNFPSLPAVPLGRILSYLGKEGLLQSRLVSRIWNRIALEQFPELVNITTAEFILMGAKHDDNNPISKFDPRVFRWIKHLKENPQPEHTSEQEKTLLIFNNFFIIFLKYLKVYNLNSFIVKINVSGSEGIEALVLVVNCKELPNLKELAFHHSRRDGKHNYVNRFLPQSLKKLQVLELNFNNDKKIMPSTQSFIQSVADAAPNLVEIQTNVAISLTNHHSLKKVRAVALRASKTSLFQMLDGVKDRIEFLIIFAPHENFQLPVMRKLTVLHLEHVLPVKLPVPVLSKAVPNLKILRTFCYEGEDPTVTKYLESKPKSLRQLTLHCCCDRINGNHDWAKKVCSTLAKSVPTLGCLKIFSKFGMLEAEGGGLLEFLVNLDFDNVVIRDVGGTEFLSKLLTGLGRLEVKVKQEKNGTLEFCSENQTNCSLEADLIEGFPLTMQKLCQRWSRIIIRNLDIPVNQIEDLQRNIEKHNLPVDLYYAFGG